MTTTIRLLNEFGVARARWAGGGGHLGDDAAAVARAASAFLVDGDIVGGELRDVEERIHLGE